MCGLGAIIFSGHICSGQYFGAVVSKHGVGFG